MYLVAVVPSMRRKEYGKWVVAHDASFDFWCSLTAQRVSLQQVKVWSRFDMAPNHSNFALLLRSQLDCTWLDSLPLVLADPAIHYPQPAHRLRIYLRYNVMTFALLKLHDMHANGTDRGRLKRRARIQRPSAQNNDHSSSARERQEGEESWMPVSAEHPDTRSL